MLPGVKSHNGVAKISSAYKTVQLELYSEYKTSKDTTRKLNWLS